MKQVLHWASVGLDLMLLFKLIKARLTSEEKALLAEFFKSSRRLLFAWTGMTITCLVIYWQNKESTLFILLLHVLTAASFLISYKVVHASPFTPEMKKGFNGFLLLYAARHAVWAIQKLLA